MNKIAYLWPAEENEKTSLTRIVEQLRNSRSVLVSAHTTPDGDAVCALLALGFALESMQKQVFMHSEKPVPPQFYFLPSVCDVACEMDPDRVFDTAVFLNCPEFHINSMVSVLQHNESTVINIDHHLSNAGFGDLQLIDHRACGAAEIVYRIIKKLPTVIDDRIAMAIYTGIHTDTDSFRLKNTNRAAFGISAEMLGLGVPAGYVARQLTGTYSMGQIKLLNRAIDSLEISNNGKVSVMTLTREVFQDTGTQPGDIDGIINCAYQIEGVKLAILIKETALSWTDSVQQRRCFHVSLKSGDDVNAAQIAEAYDGSGNANAAGFFITTTLSELKALIFKVSESIVGDRLEGQSDMLNNFVEDVPRPAFEGLELCDGKLSRTVLRGLGAAMPSGYPVLT